MWIGLAFRGFKVARRVRAGVQSAKAKADNGMSTGKKKLIETVFWGVLGGLTGIAVTPGGPGAVTQTATQTQTQTQTQDGGPAAPTGAAAGGSAQTVPCPPLPDQDSTTALGNALVVALLSIAAYLRQNTGKGGGNGGSGEPPVASAPPIPPAPSAPAGA